MFHHPGIARGRRTGALALAGAVLLAGLTACSDPVDAPADDSVTDSAPPTNGEVAADAAAEWLTGQLTDGVIVNQEFGAPDYGATVDAVYALHLLGDHESAVEEMTSAVTAAGEEYVAPGDDMWAGNAGKLVSLVMDHGDGEPADVDGFDALSALEKRVDDNGRISDKSEQGDFANMLGQAWAVRGLTTAGSDTAFGALHYLLQQQCEDGSFRQDLSAPDSGSKSCDGSEGSASIDATATVMVVLADLARDNRKLAAAFEAATTYLVAAQEDDGSFTGGDELPANSNSTGLAGRAVWDGSAVWTDWTLDEMAEVDEAGAKAAAWVRAHQLPACEGDLAEAAGAIGYDDAALTAAGSDGITDETSYQWQLATAQALPALLYYLEEGVDPPPCPGDD